MDQYVRVSRLAGREGERFISPDVQREQGEAWARLRGVEVPMVHEDLDQSGGKLDRPGLNKLLARIRAGETDGVIVSKLDRLSRLGVADALRLVEEITDAGGSIAAVDLGIDPTTPFGEFGMTIMLALARMERRRLSESWEQAKTRALDRGARMGPTPFGYERDSAGRLQPHPQWAPVLKKAFKLAAKHGVDAALEYLLEMDPPIPSTEPPGVHRKLIPNHRTWNAYTVRRLLRKRTYLGETQYGDRLIRDSHPALVDRVTFERAQPGPEIRVRRGRAVFPLSGFATCAGCGETLVGARGGVNKDGTGKRAYRCRASLAAWRGKRCSAPANVVADLLETYVLNRLKQAYEQSGDPVLATSVTDDDARPSFDDLQHELQASETRARALRGRSDRRRAARRGRLGGRLAHPLRARGESPTGLPRPRRHDAHAARHRDPIRRAAGRPQPRGADSGSTLRACDRARHQGTRSPAAAGPPRLSW